MSRLMSAAAGAVVAAALSFASAYAASAEISMMASAPNNSGAYQTRATTVAYGDVDLGTAAGAEVLLARIDSAARAVCGETKNKAMNVARTRLFEACRARVVRYAVKEVDAPKLTELAASR